MLRRLRLGMLIPWRIAGTRCGSTPSGPPKGDPHTLGSTGTLHVECARRCRAWCGERVFDVPELSGGPMALGGVDRLVAARVCGSCSSAGPRRPGARLGPAWCEGGDKRSDSLSCGNTGSMASGLEKDGTVRNGRSGGARGELCALDPSLVRSSELRQGCDEDVARCPRAWRMALEARENGGRRCGAVWCGVDGSSFSDPEVAASVSSSKMPAVDARSSRPPAYVRESNDPNGSLAWELERDRLRVRVDKRSVPAKGGGTRIAVCSGWEVGASVLL